MSVSTSEEVLDPANRPTVGTIPASSSRIPNPKETTMASWDGKILAEVAEKDDSEDCLLNKANERRSMCRGDHICQEKRENEHSGSSSFSSTSSGSLGDVPISPNKRGSSNEHAYLSSVDANLPLEVINPILDLVDDDDEDAFGIPLSQQDEKLLEELLRYILKQS